MTTAAAFPTSYVFTVKKTNMSGVPYVNLRLNESLSDVAITADGSGETGSTEVAASEPFGPGLPFRGAKAGPVGPQVTSLDAPLTKAQEGAFATFDAALRASGLFELQGRDHGDSSKSSIFQTNYDISLRDTSSGAQRSWFTTSLATPAPIQNALDALGQLRADLG